MIAFLTCAYLPYLDNIMGVRNNRIYLLGIGIIFGLALVLFVNRQIFIPLLIAYIGAVLFFGKSMNEGTAIYIIAGMVGLFTIGTLTYPRWKSPAIYNAICCIAIANVVFSVFQLYSIPVGRFKDMDISIMSNSIRTVGLMANPNEFSILLAMCLPFFFRKKWALLLPIVVFGFVLSNSTNGVLAGVFITGIYSILKYGKKGLALCVILTMAFIGYTGFIDNNTWANERDGRLFIYGKTVQIGMTNPFVGWGFGQYEFVIPLLTYAKGLSEFDMLISRDNLNDPKALDKTVVRMVGTTDQNKIISYFSDPANNAKARFGQAHNEYAEMFFTTGIIGLLLMLSVIVSVLRKGFKMADKLPVLSFTASCLTAVFFFSWQIIPIAILTILSMVMIVGEKHD